LKPHLQIEGEAYFGDEPSLNPFDTGILIPNSGDPDPPYYLYVMPMVKAFNHRHNFLGVGYTSSRPLTLPEATKSKFWSSQHRKFSVAVLRA